MLSFSHIYDQNFKKIELKKFEINAEVISWSRGICKGRGSARIDGEVACEADMLITIDHEIYIA